MKIYHGDCLVEMDKIADHSVDMILCDLPYGSTACKWDVCIPFEPLWQQYWRVLKPNGAVVLFGSQPFTTKLITSQLENFKLEIIWEKSRAANLMLAKKQILKVHENIIVFYKKPPTYNPNKWLISERFIDRRKKLIQENKKKIGVTGIDKKDDLFIRPIDNGERYPMSVLSCATEGNAVHPTQKPVALLEYLIKTYTNENETVLDNCMGSGSTGVACVNTNRNFIGIEKDDKYFEIAKNRIGII